MSRHPLVIFAAFLMLIGSACNLNVGSPPPTPRPTATPTPPTAAQGWTLVAPGVETRSIQVGQTFTNIPFNMIVTRIDPAQALFRVHYVPGTWRTFPEWQAVLSEPLLIVNGSFFTQGGEAVGLVVADGQRFGSTLRGFGGMFQVIKDDVRVRSLVGEPFTDDAYNQVVQGFPMLIEPGGFAASTGDGFDDPARRTMIAQDRQGRVLLMVTPLGQLTLRNAQAWLLSSELDIDVAFGLDGGKSTGLYLNTGGTGTSYPSIDPVPAVIAVYPR